MACVSGWAGLDNAYYSGKPQTQNQLDLSVSETLTLLFIGGQLLNIAFLIRLSQLSHKFQQNHSRNIKLLRHCEMICIRNNS
jgi:hypothetical protein